MPKLSPSLKLLRKLARANRKQLSLFSGMLRATSPVSASKRRKKTNTNHAARTPGMPGGEATKPSAEPIAPGKWRASVYPLPHQSTLAPSQHLAYWLYLPDRSPTDMPHQGFPLVVMLHGCHQSATQFAQGTRMNVVAEAKGYAVLYPQQNIAAQGQRCWRWYRRPVQVGGGETEAIAGLIKHVSAQHAIDRRRIYACGISAGAGMAAILALNHPALIAAIGMHSGPVFGVARNASEAISVMRHGGNSAAEDAVQLLQFQHSAPAILIHGECDHVVRPVNQEHLTRQWLRLNGLPENAAFSLTVKPATRSGSRHAYEVHDYRPGPKPILRVIRIADLGHAWSGGDPSVRFNTAAGPDASRLMLDFFRLHQH